MSLSPSIVYSLSIGRFSPEIKPVRPAPLTPSARSASAGRPSFEARPRFGDDYTVERRNGRVIEKDSVRAVGADDLL
jgi:hypothetical protein